MIIAANATIDFMKTPYFEPLMLAQETQVASWPTRGSINLNVHFHQIFLDGVYELDRQGRPANFHITKAPTRRELDDVLELLIQRVARWLEKRGIIERDEDSLQLDLSEDDALSRVQSKSFNASTPQN